MTDILIQQEIIKEQLTPRNLLEVFLPTGTMRILENETIESLTINGDMYLGAPLKIGDIPKTQDTELQKVSIEISNVAQSLSGIIGLHGDVITGTKAYIYKVFLNEAGEIISGESLPIFFGKCNNIQIDIEVAKFDIEMEIGGYTAKSPNMTYGVSCQVRRFKDCRCNYQGSVTKCDRTMDTCESLGNLDNFRGFPSIPREMVIKAE